MKHLKRYKSFLEDGTAAVSVTTAGMGAVVSAQPGDLPGTTGTTGSGDVSFYMLDKKGKKIKKGTPSEVSDARYLAPAEGITKVKESRLDLDYEESNMIEECLQELYDMGFTVKYFLDSKDEEYDIDDDNYGTFKSQELKVVLYKTVEKVWRGNLRLRYLFNRDESYEKYTSTLRPGGGLESYESEISEALEDACHKLINHLEYTSGVLTVYFEAPGQATPPMTSSSWNKGRQINIDINIVFSRNVYPTNESYNDIQDYISNIIDRFKVYNIRPLVLNHIIEQCEEQISQYYEEGKDPKFFVDEIVKDMELDSGGFMAQKMGSAGYSKVIKYL
jgi:hypothetical protein